MNKILFILCLITSSICYSQHEKINIKNTLNTFFEGLHKGDTTIINSVIGENLKMQTTFINKDGNSILKTESKENFFKSIVSKKVGEIWFEKLMSMTIQIDDNLASVWTPYEFYLNNKFSHCGTNSFQLFKNNGNWEIIYLIDTRKRKGCKNEN